MYKWPYANTIDTGEDANIFSTGNGFSGSSLRVDTIGEA